MYGLTEHTKKGTETGNKEKWESERKVLRGKKKLKKINSEDKK